MKRAFFILILACSFAFRVAADEKEMKILVLIIASDRFDGPEIFPPYIAMQNTWRSYMHLDPDHVEAYFIKGDPNLETDFEIRGDVIWSKVEESWIPGILRKTLASLDCMRSRFSEFDYVLRTNLSSFYVFPRLLEFLKTAPREKCYCGPVINDDFISGCGFILSRDVVELLMEQKGVLWNCRWNDDVAIAKFLRSRGVELLGADWTLLSSVDKWRQIKDSIPSDVFHFRTKNEFHNLRGTDELFIQSELLKMFYGTSAQANSLAYQRRFALRHVPFRIFHPGLMRSLLAAHYVRGEQLGLFNASAYAATPQRS
jgi:hypothetical protein